MNAPDLRPIDFDAYRQRATALRSAAIDSLLDRGLGLLRSLVSAAPRPAGRGVPTTPFAA